MAVPTNIRTIINATNLSGNSATTNWTYIPIRSSVNANQNPAFNRQVTLTDMGVLITRGGSSAGIVLEDLCILLAKVNPVLTWPPIVNPQPANIVVSGNTAFSFQISATDEIGGDMTYQWKYTNGVNVAASTPFSNVTTNTLNISNGSGHSTEQYICTITNPSGITTTAKCGFADITAQPSNASVTHPAAAMFEITASSALTMSYQWTANGVNIAAAGSANYAGWNTNTLSVGNSTGLNGTHYYCVVSVPGFTVGAPVTGNSSNATLTVS